jgi:predicted AlkP superfamily phosphohydrolase/phosphomutase/tetratricopeptide (TPR) repeat protein
MSDATGKQKVLLIGWDAADWEIINPLLEEGLMPSLDGLINRGVMGNLATLQPILSPMLWNSVATGKFADKHGIHGFIEPDPKNGGARPYTSTSRKCKALWNILTQSNLSSNIVGWWASHPAEPIKGTVVTNAFSGVKYAPEQGWRVPQGTIHPPEKSALLARFRVFANELTEAHILPFIPNAQKIDQQSDQRLSTFTKILSDAASIQAVATALMELEPADFTAVYYDAVDHFSHAFMPYNPPRLDWVKEEDFELYKEVVRGAYRFHDMMLERLLQLAGPETTIIICSDHGFESGVQRPRATPREPAGPAVWHRQFGILVMAGPGVKHDERIYGASLIDIAPTILTIFGLPIGEDMDGRPLLEAFEIPPEVKTIESWEGVAGESGMHSANTELDPDQAQELMQHFAALGYIEDPGADKEKAAESAEIEAKYNISRTYLWKHQPDRALPLLEEIVRRRPWEDRFLSHLALCYFQNGYLSQAEKVISAISDNKPPEHPLTMLLLAKIKFARGDFGGCLESLLAAEAMNPQTRGVYTQIGEAFERLFQWDNAQAAYEKAIAIDEDDAFALEGLSSIYRQKKLNQETVDMALRAVSLLYRLPVAHFNLGVGLARAGEPERAILAFETALRFRPKLVHAHRYLFSLYRSNGNQEKAAFHREEIEKIVRTRPEIRTREADRSEKLFDLPEIPNRKERLKILLQERPDPKPDEKKSGKVFALVSGLPRSGTSLMMQMLAAGGMKILTDEERTPDVDNPKGYYEWEPLKQIGKNPELLDEEGLDGNAIKCISMLLPKMPLKHNYKVIFMTRPIEEVVASQNAMINRLASKAADLDPEQLQRGLRGHRHEILHWLKSMPNIEVLEVNYPTLVRNAESESKRVRDFLGADLLPHPEKMAAVIDPSLYRRQKSAR